MDELANLIVDSTVATDGDRARVVLFVDIPAGVHIEPHEPSDPFLIPTVVSVDGLDDVQIEYPIPVEKDLGWNDVVLTVLEGPVEFVVTGRVRDQISSVSGEIRYQPCVGGACLPPRTSPWSVRPPAPVEAGTRGRAE